MYAIDPQWGVKRLLRHQDPDDRARRNKDATAAAAIPSDEDVQIACIWVAEVFLSSHSYNLGVSLRSLALEADDLGIGESRIDGVNAFRSVGGGSVYLGYLVPRESGAAALGRATAALPTGVESAFFHAVSPIQGVTVVVGQFRFDEETSRSASRALLHHYEDEFARVGERWGLRDGRLAREAAVERERDGLRARCDAWMRREFRGLFGLDGEQLPAVELLTLHRADPMLGYSPPRADSNGDLQRPLCPRSVSIERTSPITPDYLTILGIGHHGEAYAGHEYAGLVLRVRERGFWNRKEDRLSLAVRLLSTAEGNAHVEKPDSRQGAAAWTCDLQEAIACFALAAAVSGFERKTALLRDRLGSLPLRASVSSMRQLESSLNALAALSRDAAPLARRLADSPLQHYLWKLPRFVEMDNFRTGKPVEYFSDTAARTIMVAVRLSAELAELRSTAEMLSGLVVAGTNYRLQRTAIRVAALAALLAALAIPGAWKHAAGGVAKIGRVVGALVNMRN